MPCGKAAQEPLAEGMRMVSIVVPMLNEEANLVLLVDRVAAAMAGQPGGYELVCVLDGCTDGSLGVLLGLREGHPEVKVVELDRRVGQHAALAVGLAYAWGNLVVTLDADLQNPPEEVPKLVDLLSSGYEAVGTVRRSRQDSALRKSASLLFRVVLAHLGGRYRMADPGCMLRGWRREVVDRFLESGESPLYLPVQLNRRAASYSEIEAAHEARAGGESRYGPLRLARLLCKALVAARAPRLGNAKRPVVKATYGIGG